MEFHRTRIAPTPSGFLHLGNAYSFLLTQSLAQQTGASILLRIDDLDQARAQTAYVQDIFDTLEFLEIQWQEGPKNPDEFKTSYSQLHRLSEYNKALEQLRQKNLLFACSCSRSDLQRSAREGYPGTCRHKNIPLDSPGVNWRLRTDEDHLLTIRTFPGETTKARLTADMRDFIVRKKDGHPSYQLASLADDLYFKVDLIVRGEDLWPSTLAQLYLAKQLGATEFLDAHFHHHSLLLDKGEKMSKSAGATSIKFLRQQGMSAAEVRGMLDISC